MMQPSRNVGRYELDEVLGQGPQHMVWLARHVELDQTVVLKMPIPEAITTPAEGTAFYQGARAMALMEGRCAPRIVDVGSNENGTPFLVMDRLEGETLEQLVMRERRLPLPFVARALDEVARGLERLHGLGFVHCGINLSNVFLSREGEGIVARLLGFSGVSRVGSRGKLHPSARLHFASPEQLRGAQVDARTDLWGLGVIAFTAATGVLPFDARTPNELAARVVSGPRPVPSSVARDLPPAFDPWFLRACDPNPENRFRTSRALAAALWAAMGILPEEQRCVSCGEPIEVPPMVFCPNCGRRLTNKLSSAPPPMRPTPPPRVATPPTRVAVQMPEAQPPMTSPSAATNEVAAINVPMIEVPPASVTGQTLVGEAYPPPLLLAEATPTSVTRPVVVPELPREGEGQIEAGKAEPAPVGAGTAQSPEPPPPSAPSEPSPQSSDAAPSPWSSPSAPPAPVRPTAPPVRESPDAPSAWMFRSRLGAAKRGEVLAGAFVLGGTAVMAVRASGVSVSHGSAWESVTLDAKVDLSRVRAVRAIAPDAFLLLGEGGLVARVGLDGRCEFWPLEPHAGAPVAAHELTFYDALADKDGAVIVGERSAAQGTVGVVARASDGAVRITVLGTPNARLRSITRMGGGTLLACGAGTIVALDRDAVVGSVRIAPGDLFAIEATDDGALCVGAGAYAFSIARTLRAQLEEVQTTSDLVALAIGSNVGWAGSRRGGRILRRSSTGVWTRLTGDLGTDAGVVALSPGHREIRALLDDGTYVTGTLF